MSEKISEIFQNLDEVNPPSFLKDAILRKVALEREKKIRLRAALSKGGLVFSLGTFFLSGMYYGNTFLSSDFWNLVKLGFSDFNIVAQYSYEFLMSLLENFPTVSAVAILLPVFTFFLSLGYYKEFNNNYHKYV